MAAPALRPPTNLLGTVDEGRYFALAVDWAETVPDVIWPLSVQTFAAMRNDPAVSAVLSAVMLPIRRATWVVDPAGCRPEIAQLVADDLGLPVLGEDKPGAARVRGVSWPEHLRAALMYLVYGHAGFEMLADVTSGLARLVGLYERTQHTISFIHSTPTGDFGGISQFYHPDKEEAPEIPAERMVFYSHAREGSAWHGRSLLRSLYAPWLLKREMQRVLATSSRRFGMGVPTVEWQAGVTPTPTQHQQAVQAASAARVGEQSGLALPPGAQLVLKGLSGGTPDTLAFIKWLNSEISKSALAQFLDLGGESSHGSRALGESFIDLFTLSIAAVAEEIADQITRQAAARIVEWNHGTGEPVPAITVTDIGTKHEITADALLQLMQAGAVTADPALEAYVRKAYQLPDRSIPWAPPAPKAVRGAGLAGADQTPVAAARTRRALGKPAAAGQMALPIAAADGGTQPGDDPHAQQHQAAWAAALAALLAQWPDLSTPMVDYLVGAAVAAVESGDVGALGSLAVPVSVQADLVDAIDAAMLNLAAESADHVVADAADQGQEIEAPDQPGGNQVAAVAMAVTGLLASAYASAAARKALQVGAGEVAEAVRAVLTDMGTAQSGMVADNLGGALTAAQNAGRAAALEAAGTAVKAYVAVETNDGPSQCQPCKDIAGTKFATLAEARTAYPVQGYRACLGGARCHGFIRPLWS